MIFKPCRCVLAIDIPTHKGGTDVKGLARCLGHEIYDYFKGKGGCEIVERDDGFFDVSSGPRLYFSEYDDWPEHEKKATTY